MQHLTRPPGVCMVKSFCKAGHTTVVAAAALDWYCPHHCHSTLVELNPRSLSANYWPAIDVIRILLKCHILGLTQKTRRESTFYEIPRWFVCHHINYLLLRDKLLQNLVA